MKKLVILILLLAIVKVHAQDFEFGVAGGVALYSGDLAPKEFGVYFETLNPTGGIFGRINTGRFLSTRVSLNYVKVSGDDLNGAFPERGLNFRTHIYEANVASELNIFRIGVPGTLQFIPYVFGGVGGYYFTPQTQFDGSWVNLQPLGTEGQGLEGYPEPYDQLQLNVLLGGGLKVLINDTWTLGFEFGGRALSTDYLDDVSDTRVNYQELLDGNGPLSARLSNPSITEPTADLEYTRGSPFDDWYYTGTITLSYHFGDRGSYA